MNDNPVRTIAETNRGRSFRKILIIVAVIILGIVVSPLGVKERWVIGAICPKCLQGAGITVVKIAGIPIFKRTTYSQHVHLPPSWSGRLASVPEDIHPGIYAEIFGKKCKHELKRGGFGVTSSGFFLGNVCRDGAFFESRLYQPRIEAVTALYCAFRNVPNESLARMTYARIDSALPMDNQERLQEVYHIQKMRESGVPMSDKEIGESFPAAFATYQAIEELKAFTVRLSSVASEEEWVSLLRDLDGRLERQVQTE